eukprot:CAMPEP_0176330786 /NCGR_PEP_ID=MMETSP0121_2-20121125/76204_1 /TAXON_ID=160619 /ORGANISM="Kryptoperidinium foliaceum, Strain CCMP 1326" /LENGTH=44 /DNA_ID= /DNA_START= /DNA_END= /DNA_ORIENTATION=
MSNKYAGDAADLGSLLPIPVREIWLEVETCRGRCPLSSRYLGPN